MELEGVEGGLVILNSLLGIQNEEKSQQTETQTRGFLFSQLTIFDLLSLSCALKFNVQKSLTLP